MISRRKAIPRRVRLLVAELGLIIALVATSYVTHRQTELLAHAAAGPTVLPELLGAPTPSGPTPTPGRAVAVPVKGGALINPMRFSYEPDWYVPEVQKLLDGQPGPLKTLRVTIGDREHSFAEFLISQTSLYSLNPKVVLALLEMQSHIISSGTPSSDQVDWAMGYHGENEHWRGTVPQARWAMRELRRAVRDYAAPPDLVYADGSHSPVPGGLDVPQYALTRVVAATVNPGELPARLNGGPDSFVGTYTRMFGNGFAPPMDWPAPAAPFLSHPAEHMAPITSFFDHDLPFLHENGSLVSYRGDRSTTLSYDGHTGWDYGMRPPDPVLAAADGKVVFAGNSDDGCGVAHVVIIDHGNGYRTLYWHMSEVLVQPGPVKRGERIGIVGSSGCATGPHLHFQVQYLGRDVDPYGWCGPKGDDPWARYPGGQVSSWLWSWMPSPCNIPKGATLVDTGDAAFHKRGDGWQELAGGLGGTSLRVTSVVSSSVDVPTGIWQPDLPSAGRYRILAWVPYIDNGLSDASSVTYTVTFAAGSKTVNVDQSITANTWVDLGSYDFPSRGGAVRLAAQDGAAANGTTNVWFDALIWMKE